MKYAYISALLALVAPVFADPCSDVCTNKKNICLIDLGSNKTTCAAQYAQCLGYNPYEKRPYVEPVACSHAALPTYAKVPAPPASPPPAETTTIAACVANSSPADEVTTAQPPAPIGTGNMPAPQPATNATDVLPPITGAGDRTGPVMALLGFIAVALL